MTEPKKKSSMGQKTTHRREVGKGGAVWRGEDAGVSVEHFTIDWVEE